MIFPFSHQEMKWNMWQLVNANSFSPTDLNQSYTLRPAHLKEFFLQIVAVGGVNMFMVYGIVFISLKSPCSNV